MIHDEYWYRRAAVFDLSERLPALRDLDTPAEAHQFLDSILELEEPEKGALLERFTQKVLKKRESVEETVGEFYSKGRKDLGQVAIGA